MWQKTKDVSIKTTSFVMQKLKSTICIATVKKYQLFYLPVLLIAIIFIVPSFIGENQISPLTNIKPC